METPHTVMEINKFTLDPFVKVTPLIGLLASMVGGTLMPATNEIMILAHRDAVQATLDREYDRQCNENGVIDNRASSVIQSEVNPMAKASSKATNTHESNEGGGNEGGGKESSKRMNRKSSWFAAGTDDLKGFRAALATTRYSVANHVWENEGGEGR